jgi:hypothetical protein
MDRAIGTGAEKVAGFTIDGAKTLTGTTLQRDVFFIGAESGKGSGRIVELLAAFEKEAISSGATSVRIVGHEVQNPTFLRNLAVARRYGYEVKQIGSNSFELTKAFK